jgi:arginyl-tRNA synthetase
VIRDQLVAAVRAAVASCGLPEPREVRLEVPAARDHGDFATNVALQLAKPAGTTPRAVADELSSALQAAGVPHLARVEVAGPGFLNFFLEPTWLHEVLRAVVSSGDSWGHGDELVDARINLEFVSSNPTGPMHAGAGRWIATGDAIANLLAARGAKVEREYYLNDTGNQLVTFTASLSARYHGRRPPEDGYQGQYLLDLATDLRAAFGDDLPDRELCELGVQSIVDGIRDDLARIGVHFDTWFSERSLHERGDVADVLEALEQRGVTYDDDGAKWLRTTEFGDDRDRVVVTSDGRTTYLCNDLAYHRDKFRRGATHLVDIWGADHHGQVKSLQAGLTALLDTEREPEIVLGQLVKIMRDGKEVRLSKRAGNIVTLADILDEVDPDVARMTFLLQSLDTKQTFDLDVVTTQSMENPVYYVQMAHARIASIARRATEGGVTRRPLAEVDLAPLTHERETELLRALAEYPDVVAIAARERAPHKIAHWALDFAGRFHGFYRDCRVLGSPDDVLQARLWLTEACRIGLAGALGLLGVRAPDEMARLEEADQ